MQRKEGADREYMWIYTDILQEARIGIKSYSDVPGYKEDVRMQCAPVRRKRWDKTDISVYRASVVSMLELRD